jgi:hypothetical protein
MYSVFAIFILRYLELINPPHSDFVFKPRILHWNFHEVKPMSLDEQELSFLLATAYEIHSGFFIIANVGKCMLT